MKKLLLENKILALIEVMLLLAIILLFLRYVFAREILQYEQQFFLKLGIDFIWIRIVFGSLFIIYIWNKIIDDRKRRKPKLQFLKHKNIK